MSQLESNHIEYLDYLGEIADRGRTMLLPALLEAQNRYGCIPKDIAAKIGSALKVPLADITGVIEFYSMLYPEPTGGTAPGEAGGTIIRVCTSPSCSARGGHQVHREVLARFGIENATATSDGEFFVEKVECLGLCDQAPAALVGETAIGHAAPESILETHNGYYTPIYGEERIITNRIGKVNPTS